MAAKSAKHSTRSAAPTSRTKPSNVKSKHKSKRGDKEREDDEESQSLGGFSEASGDANRGRSKTIKPIVAASPPRPPRKQHRDSSGSRSGSCSQDNGGSRINLARDYNKDCSECQKPLLPGQKRYRERNTHYECGLARKSAGNILSKENLKALTDMRKTDHEKYSECILTLKANKGERSESQRNNVRGMVTEFARSLTVRRRKGWLLLNEDEFVSYKLTQGYKPKQARKLWKKEIVKPEAHTEEDDDGSLVLAVRKPTEVQIDDDVTINKRYEGGDVKGFLKDGGFKALKLDGGVSLANMGKCVGGPKKLLADAVANSASSAGSESSDASNESDSSSEQPKKKLKKAHKKDNRKGHRKRSPSNATTPPSSRKFRGGVVGDSGAQQLSGVEEWLSMKREMQANVKSKIDSFEVKGRPANHAVHADYLLVRDHPEVQTLDVPTVIQEAVDAKNILENLLSEMQNWKKSIDLSAKGVEMTRVFDDFDDKFAIMMDIHRCVLRIAGEAKMQSRAGKRTQRSARDRIRNKYVNGGCADGVAKVFAEFHQDLKNYTDVALSSPNTMICSANENFTQPVIFEAEGESHWEKQCKAGVDAMTTGLIREKITKGSAKLKKSDSPYSTQPMAVAGIDLKTGVPSECPGFKLECEQPFPLVVLQKANSMVLGLDTMPLPGVGVFISVVEGALLVGSLSLEIAVSRAFGFETMQQCLEAEDVSPSLKKMPMAFIPAGNSMYIPYGEIPLIIPQQITKEDSDVAAYFMQYVLDGTGDRADVSKQVFTEMQAAAMKAVARKSKFFEGEGLTVAVNAWFDKMKPHAQAKEADANDD